MPLESAGDQHPAHVRGRPHDEASRRRALGVDVGAVVAILERSKVRGHLGPGLRRAAIAHDVRGDEQPAHVVAVGPLEGVHVMLRGVVKPGSPVGRVPAPDGVQLRDREDLVVREVAWDTVGHHPRRRVLRVGPVRVVLPHPRHAGDVRAGEDQAAVLGGVPLGQARDRLAPRVREAHGVELQTEVHHRRPLVHPVLDDEPVEAGHRGRGAGAPHPEQRDVLARNDRRKGDGHVARA